MAMRSRGVDVPMFVCPCACRVHGNDGLLWLQLAPQAGRQSHEAYVTAKSRLRLSRDIPLPTPDSLHRDNLLSTLLLFAQSKDPPCRRLYHVRTSKDVEQD